MRKIRDFRQPRNFMISHADAVTADLIIMRITISYRFKHETRV